MGTTLCKEPSTHNLATAITLPKFQASVLHQRYVKKEKTKKQTNKQTSKNKNKTI